MSSSFCPIFNLLGYYFYFLKYIVCFVTIISGVVFSHSFNSFCFSPEFFIIGFLLVNQSYNQVVIFKTISNAVYPKSCRLENVCWRIGLWINHWTPHFFNSVENLIHFSGFKSCCGEVWEFPVFFSFEFLYLFLLSEKFILCF